MCIPFMNTKYIIITIQQASFAVEILAFLAHCRGQWAVKRQIIILVKSFNNLQTRTSLAPPVGRQSITLL